MTRLAAVVLLAALPLAAAQAKSPWRKEAVKGLFSVSVPKDWVRREFQYVSEPGTAFTDGLSRISAELHGQKSSRYPSIAEFLRQMENLGGALKKTGTVKVAGQDCPRFQRRREMRHNEEGRAFWEYTYEEYALRKVQGGFWILEFSHASPMYDAKPDGLDAWADEIC
ncbi:MAG: hypothetical protein HZB91_09065 [Elusimicrobia bacterium]|nr:hypothetical protein [Elusimicrobiota bacterium]